MPENKHPQIWQRIMQQQFARFLSVGALNTLLGYGIIFFAMYGLKLSPEISNVLGYGIGLLVSFTLTKTFTFRSTGAIRPEFARFLIVFAVSYAANLAVLSLAVRILHWHAGVSQVLAGGCYIICSYYLNKRFVFLPGKSG